MIWKENRENAYCEITPAIMALKEQWEKKNYIDPRLYKEYNVKRGLRDEDGNLYDIMAGTFLVVGLSEDSFTSLTPEQVQKYTEHFKQPEQFISLNGQIIALPVEPENPLRTAEMTLEDDYGMIDGVLNNGRKGEELEKAQGEARRTTPEKKPSIRERLAEAKRECGERKPPDRAQQKKPPEHDL